MKIVVVGGKLQGVEATYLAHQVGWNVILVDKNKFSPAVGLCDEFHQMDVTKDGDKLSIVIKNADLIIPCIEDQEVLFCLKKIADNENVPLAFDLSSYTISSSKKESDDLFEKYGIPAPSYWPKCNLPVVAKPSNSSGSNGVRKIFTSKELSDFLAEINSDENILKNWIIQEFLEGPSYSIEVLGYQGDFLALQITELEMDQMYDCKRVLAPVKLESELENQFKEIAVKIAQRINLTGIMDVEVINQNGVLKVLEIDARLPSQTPTAVYKSSGINIVKYLYDIYAGGQLPRELNMEANKSVIYEHISVSSQGIEILGEHIMATAGPLSFQENFFGAQEAITNYTPGCSSWVATLIIIENSPEEAWDKHLNIIKNIQNHINVPEYTDSSPL